MAITPALPDNAPPRRLGLAHFAFYRAYLEGTQAVNLAVLADTFFACGRDPRRLPVLVRGVQTELAAAARRTQDWEAVRLLRLPRLFGQEAKEGAAADCADTTLDLAAFAAEIDPNSVYSEHELLALYTDRYPAPAVDRKQRQKTRLRERRLAALQRLETVVADAPRGAHTVVGWFEPAVAARLEAVGLTTLARLVDAINVFGHRWYRHVPRLGPSGAACIVCWLQANMGSIGGRLAPHVAVPLRQQATAHLMTTRAAEVALGGAEVAPLEALQLPHALSGAIANNRAELTRNRTGATNDLEAIHAWLQLRPAGSHTYRSYRTQAERLLLWSVFVCGKPLSSLDVRDLSAYKSFMADPDLSWINPTKTPRWQPQWRPFSGPLSIASRATACAVLKSCFAWLVKMRYLDHNPWDGLTSTEAEKAAVGMKAYHALTRSQWEALFACIDARATNAAGERARFLVLLAYATGLRIAEIGQATLGDLNVKWIDDQFGEAWTLTVIGKRSKRRTVPMQRFVMTALARYLDVRGLPNDPRESDAGTPLIAKTNALDEALPPLQVGRVLKQAIEQAAGDLAARDPTAAQRLALASAHWLRHTYGTHAVEAGVDLDVVQENLGHASPATTKLYVTTALDRRIRAMEEAFSMPKTDHLKINK
ncbi:MAG: tyrosine-type recombinase/integrase [Janthinobacterium lividum]